jgi:hypothetical protein
MGPLFMSLSAISQSKNQWPNVSVIPFSMNLERSFVPSGLANVCFVISVNIIKVLGEGGFSFVYLAQDETSGVSDLMSSFLTTSYI